jgi:hypothetical protein
VSGWGIAALWVCPLATWAGVWVNLRSERRQLANQRAHQEAMTAINAKFKDWVGRAFEAAKAPRQKRGDGAEMH